jgi:beta-carotene ketolase (CrtW type)
MSNSATKIAGARWPGPLLGLGIIASWCGLLAVALTSLDPLAQPLPSLLVFLAMIYLSTGLFITAHDAMHGTVWPNHRGLNNLIGRVAVGLYAAFSLDALLAAHKLHHAAPATSGDPDFHDGNGEAFAGWYLAFLRRYITWRQIALMAIAFNVAAHLLHVAQPRLIAFWVIPTLLSTLQLFTFGTWLPHRHQHAAADAHRARSSALPRWLSLLACYHFDYHWEHHAHPHLPWWRLPAARWSERS